MKSYSFGGLISLGFLALVAAYASDLPREAPGGLSLIIRPSDPLLHFNGRFNWEDPDAPRASFPGSELVVHFIGSELAAKMSTSGEDEIQVVIDGRPESVLKLSNEPALYTVGRDLGPW